MNRARPDLPTIMLVGKTKVGKSSICIKALGPKGILWVATERHSLNPALNPEFNPSRQLPEHVMCLAERDACAEVQNALQRKFARKRYGFVVLDTLSTLADREYTQITNPKRRGGDDIEERYGRAGRELARRLRPILDMCLAQEAGFIALAHDREPLNIQGNQTYGGPRLPGKLVEIAPSLFSTVLRIDINGAGERVFQTFANDRTYMLGDSSGVVEDGMPADLRLVLQRMVLRAHGKY